MNSLRHALALTFLRKFPATIKLEMLRRAGNAEAVFSDEFKENISNELSQKLKNAFGNTDEAFQRADEEICYAEEHDIRLLAWGNDNYPRRLLECTDAPLVLSYKGNATLNARHLIAIVGTREITSYGVELCAQFCKELSQILPDCVVVSGLAYGVDINAHREALKNNLFTIGVLAHGLEQIYPTLHRSTASEMVNQGGLITEYFPKTRIDKGNFVRRNRIIAGLTDATIVIESAAKGGALITASIAESYHRDVFAFPGRVDDTYSQGCNNLIRQNKAALITSAEDFVRAMCWEDHCKPRQEKQLELFTELPDLTDEEAMLCKKLAESDGMAINHLIVALNSTYDKVAALLLELEFKGMIHSKAGGQYELTSAYKSRKRS